MIDIEGVIGQAEEDQFSDAAGRISTYETLRRTLEKLGDGDLVVNIRSTGGNVHNALLMHDALAGSNRRVTTRCFGYVASAATIIAQAASKGQREISANSLYLIHNSTGENEGDAVQLSQTASLLRETDLRIASIYASQSGRPTVKFISLMGENNGSGRWLSPREAIKAGLADKIVGAEPIAEGAIETVRNLGLPEMPGGRNTTLFSKLLSHIFNFLSLNSELPDPEAVAEAAPESAASFDGHRELRPAAAVTPQNSVADPGSQNVRSQTKATTVIQREDPAPGESVLSPNDAAYRLDARNLLK